MIKRNSDPNKRKFTTSETILLVVMSLLIGLCIGGLLSKTNVITKTSVIKNKNLQELIQNYDYIVNNYYEKVDQKKLVDGAINGMMESLDDQYSVYMDETQSNNFSITLDGSYKGIGVQIVQDEETGNIIIVSVFKNSPAHKSGLIAGDEIIEIDGVPCNKYSVDEFSALIRESEKDTFELKVLRDGKKQDIKLNKSIVTLKSVTSEIYEKNDKKIGYIYIGIFASNTYYQFKDLLDELEKEKIDSLIIDVRGNTGGHLTAVDSILDIFLTSKQRLYGFEKNNKKSYIYGTGIENKKYEIVLLGDESSASASEVLIAGLKENLNSKFFGKKTFGKGTVQEMVNLTDGSQYKITIKKWITPKGNWINNTEGIIPDEEVDMSEEYYKTLSDEDDTQLNYAIKYLSK